MPTEGVVLPWVEYEKLILVHALETAGWNIQEAVRSLGIGRATMYRKLEKYGLRRPGTESNLGSTGTEG